MVPHVLKKAKMRPVYMQIISMSQNRRLWRTLKTHIFSVFVSKGGQVYSELRLMSLRVDISSIIIPVHSSAQLDRNLQFLRANDSDECWLSRKLFSTEVAAQRPSTE